MEELVQLLESKEPDYETGKLCAQKLFKEFNCFGTYGKMMKDLYGSLSDYGKEKLLLYISLAASEMAIARTERGSETWDDRFKASERFAFENNDLFKHLFLSMIDRIVPGSDKINLDMVGTYEWRNKGYGFLVGFLSYWKTGHSTLKQAIFGGFCRGLLEDMLPDLGYPNIIIPGFPFI